MAVVPLIAVAAAGSAPYGGTDLPATGEAYPGTGLPGAAGAWPEPGPAAPAGLLGHAHAEPSQPVTGRLVPVSSVWDGADGFTALDGPRSAAAFQIGRGTYVAVASQGDGIQIIDVTDPANPAAAASFMDSSIRELAGARAIEAFETGGRTYAIVAGFSDDGVQIVDVSDPRRPVAAGHIGAADLREFDGPSDVAVFRAGGGLYAAVTTSQSNTVQIIDIADPLNPAPAGRVQDDQHLELNGASGVDTFETGGGVYAIAVGYRDNGVQIVNVTDPHAPAAAGSLADSASLELHHAFDVETFESGGDVYAAVAGYEDYGIQVINVTDPLNPAPAGRVTTRAGGGEFSRVVQIDLFEAGGATYAVAPAYQFGSIHLVDLADPHNPADLAHIRPSGYSTGYGIEVFEAGGGLYAIYTELTSDNAHILRISLSVDRPPRLVPNPPLPASIQAGSAYEDAGAACVDEVDGDLTGQIRATSTVDPALPGDYTVTYACADSAGNEAVATRTVTVTGPVPATPPAGAPAITVVGANPAEVAVGGAYADAGATCADEADGDLTGSIRTTSYVNVHAHGNYTVTYSCADSAGNEAVATRTVSVIDADAPRIALLGNSAVRMYAGDAYADAGATCIDRVEGDLSDYVAAAGNVDTAAAGRYAVTYTCADSAGNEAAATRTVLVLDPTYLIADGVGGYTELEGASGVAVFERGGSTYAIVAAAVDDGVQVIDVTDPNRPAAAGSIPDGPELELDGASGVAVFERGGSTYAIVAAYGDDGVQVINVTDPNRPAAAGSISDGPELELDGASGVAVFERGGDTYAIVAAAVDDGVQVIDVTDPNRPAAAGSIPDGPELELDGASGVAVFERGGSTYAIVAAYGDDGVQVIDVTDPNRPAAAGSISESRHHHLYHPTDVAVFERGGSTYAIVAAYYDDGVQVINVTDPYNPAAAGKQGYDDSSLDGLSGVTAFEDGGRTYAIITQTLRDGIRIVDVTNPSGPVLRNVIYDNEILRLNGASDAATFRAGGSTYAIVAASYDDGAQIIPVAVTAAARAPPTIALNGASPDRIEAGSAYADAGASCTDDIDGDLTDLVQAISDVNAAVPGNYTVTYSCSDSVGSTATAVREVVVEDTRPPTLLSAAYVIYDGTLQMNFSEPLSPAVHWDRLHVRDTGGSSGGVTLDGAPGSVHGATLTATLSASQMGAVGNLTAPQLDIGRGAVADLYGNGIAAAPDRAIALHDRNLPPTVEAGPDQTVYGGQDAALNGTASDPDGDSMTYLWTHDRPDLGITLADPAAPSTTFAAPQVGSNATVTFTLAATDAHNATSTDRVTVTVARLNGLPTVEAGPDQNAYMGQAVALTGTASDPDGDSMTYLWTHDRPDLAITLANATSTSATLTAHRVPSDTTISVTLTAHDGAASSSDSLNVTIRYVNTTVVWTPDQAPGRYGISRIALTGTTPGTIQATWDEPTREPFKYRISWAKVDEPYRSYTAPSGNAFPTTTSHTITGLEEGHTYKVNMRADYNGYAGPWSGDIIVAVAGSAANSPPTVEAGPDQTVTGGQNATLAGTASDPDGDSMTYLWTHDRPGLGITLADPAAPYTTFAAPQVASNATVTFTLAATDAHNATASDTTTVTIMPGTPEPVEAHVIKAPDAPQNLRATPAHDSVILAWDPPDDDSITGYRVLSTSPANQSRMSVLVAQTNGTEASYTVTDLRPSTAYVFGVAAVNEHGESGPSEPVIVYTAAPAHTHFVTTWGTAGANESITIPVGGVAGTYTVDWGDGTVSANVTGNQVHAYGTPGTHTVRIYGDFTRIHLNELYPNVGKLQSIEQWGDIRWESMSGAFEGASNMVYRATDAPDLSGVTDTSWMFRGATSFDGDLSAWDVSSVTNMYYMFHGATSFNGNVSTWDVSSVTDAAHMFSRAHSFNADISAWNVSSVTDMHGMFSQATSFNGDISAWNVSSVTDTHSMFPFATSFNGNISAWDVSSVTDMRNMFSYSTSFNGDISAWDVSSVTDMSYMFNEASSFDGDISAWDVSSVADMSSMFSDADRFNGNISAWDVSSVTDMYRMLDGASSFNGDISAWNVSSVADMRQMFSGATSFDGDISAWDVSSVTDMSYMFYGTTSFNGDISAWDVSSVADMRQMFDGADAFDQNLGNWYMVLDDLQVDGADGSVGVISAQNAFLATQGPVYGMGPGGDSDSFEIVNGSTLRLKAPLGDNPARSSYAVTVTSAGGFGTGNSRTFEIAAAEGYNAPPVVEAGADQTVREGDTVTLSGTASDDDRDGTDTLTYLWSHDSSLDIAFANSTAPYTTLTAPEVPSDTTVTITLTADDGTHASSDTLALTVTDTAPVSDALQPSAFVTTWQTTAANEPITIPVGGAAGTYTVDWGDGTVSADVTGDQTHTYHAAGTYTVSISGDFARIHLNGDANAAKLRSIDQWGAAEWESMELAFKGASSMVYRATDSPDLSGVTSMRHMFHGASSFDGDLSSWDVSSVTNMIGAFRDAATFDGDISSWDVSGANDMRRMFHGASSFNQDLSSWDVSGAIAMTGMFYGASSFNGDVSSWDVSSVTDTRYMFRDAASFNQDLSSWDVSSVATMVDMFYGASSFDGDISSWDVSSVATMAGMFYGASSFDGDISSWDVSSVASTADMFRGASSFNGDLSSWDVSGATDMGDMFRQAGSFARNLGSWYITLDDTAISSAGETLAISAQNAYLDGQNPDYSVADARFAVAGGALAINPGQAPQPGSYNVTIASAGGFGTGNSRVVEITVDLGQAVRPPEAVEPAANQTGQDDPPANRPPAVQAGPDLTAAEGSTVTLSGTASDPDGDALSYLWAHDSQTPISLDGPATLSPSFTAPQVSSNTTITITLTATDARNATATDSLTVTVTDAPQPGSTPPDAPQNLQAASTTNTTITLTWDPAGDDSITGYKILSRTPHTQTELSVLVDDTGSSDASYVAEGLDPDTVYVFRVIAVNEHGESDRSNFVRLSTNVTDAPQPDSTPPDAPQNLQAASTTNTTITLTWDPAGDDSITGYKILSRTPHTQTELSVLVDDTGSSDASYVAEGLDPDTVYVFRVIAVNEHGESDRSNFVRLSTLP